MMLRWAGAFTLACSALAWTALPATAEDIAVEDVAVDYSFVRMAEFMDDNCRLMQFVERDAIRTLATVHLRQSPRFVALEEGTSTQAEFDAWRDAVDVAAKALATELGCAETAYPYMVRARIDATARVYQNMLIAVFLSGLPEADFRRIVVPQEQMDAAGRFDGLMRHIYEDGYEGFVEQARLSAESRLPPRPPDTMLGLLETDAVTDVAGVEQPWRDLSNEATGTLEHILFEVMAEEAGHVVLARQLEGGELAADLADPTGGEVRATIAGYRHSYVLGNGETVFGVLARRPDGTLRFMSYGIAAREQLGSGTVRLLVSVASPAGDEAAYRTADWRGQATAFPGARVEEACLGGPCWAFGPQASAAISALEDDGYFEVWLSPDAAAQPPAESNWEDRNSRLAGTLRRIARARE